MPVRAIAASVVILFACFLVGEASAQYPNRPIRLIVPAAPGGGTDITARSFTPALQDNLGQPVVIENRGGAGGVIGSDVVAKAAPDGYTLLLCYVSHATNPTLVDKLPYDTLRDFVPITLVSHEPTVLVTHPAVPEDAGRVHRVGEAARRQAELRHRSGQRRFPRCGTVQAARGRARRVHSVQG